MEALLQSIGNYGFPIIVSAYLLVRIEAKLDQLTKSITELRSALLMSAWNSSAKGLRQLND
ncbi:MAG: YvrJ family protein [Syntrophomonadaceae bacterium]|nr:YvrJ family protein [Syntrophomonadaceae bacterium]